MKLSLKIEADGKQDNNLLNIYHMAPELYSKISDAIYEIEFREKHTTDKGELQFLRQIKTILWLDERRFT